MYSVPHVRPCCQSRTYERMWVTESHKDQHQSITLQIKLKSLKERMWLLLIRLDLPYNWMILCLKKRNSYANEVKFT